MSARRDFIYLKWLKFHQLDYEGKYKLSSLIAFISMQCLKAQKHLKLSYHKYHLWVRNGIKGRKLYSPGDDSVENSEIVSNEGANPLFNEGLIMCVSAHLRFCYSHQRTKSNNTRSLLGPRETEEISENGRESM